MGFFRKLWPKDNLADKAAFTFTHVGLILMCLFELFVVLPIYHDNFSTMFYVHFGAGLFILVQIFSNMYKSIFTDSTVNSTKFNLPSVLMPDWRYCSICQVNTPLRSHHCKLCDVCVIKRDHHCIFTGKCIGFLNHRYFFWMASYLWIGCFYTISFNKEYYLDVLGGFRWSLIFQFFCPMLAWLFGYANGQQLMILLIGGVNMMAMFLFSCLMSFQIFFISRGQTQFECKKKIRDYNRGLFENWKLVLGKKWYLTWLCYCIPSALPGTGTDFKKLDQSDIGLKRL